MGGTIAQELPPCENCADRMTVVSWGGAYQISQQKAYTEPYADADRHQVHLGRELERGDRQDARPVRGRQRHLGPGRRRGPGLAAALRRGPGGGDRRRRGARARRRRLDPDRGLRRQPGQRLLHPADRVLDHLRLPHRRGRVGGPRARGPLRALRPGELPRQARAREAAEEEPRMGAALRRRRQGGALRRARHARGRRPRARQARHHQGPGDLVVGRRRDAAAARRRRDRDGLDLQRPALLGDRGAEAAGQDALGLADLRLRRLDRARPTCPRTG